MKILIENYQAVIEIDDDDLHEFSRHRWYVATKGNTRYVSRRDGASHVFLHRQLLGVSKGAVVDHIDGNGLNNSRSNLRILSHAQNLWNRRGTDHGVCFSSKRRRWRSTITHEGRRLELGFFTEKADALRARDVASLILRGNIGSLNSPDIANQEFPWISFSPKAREILKQVHAST